MAQEVTVRTFEDILNAILERGKIASDIDTAEDSTLSTLKRFVNDRYHNVSYLKKWPWREETRIITPFAKFTLESAAPGTTFTFVEQSRTITASSAIIIDNSWIGFKLYNPGTDRLYTVISTESTTALNLDAGYIGADVTTDQTVFFADTYGLFPDYADIVEIKSTATRGQLGSRVLDPVSSEEMSKLQSSLTILEAETPSCYTIAGQQRYEGPAMGEMVMGYDFMGEPLTPAIVFYPGVLTTGSATSITYAAPLMIKYGIQITPLVENEDQPLIPLEKRRILVNGALADWFALQNKNEQSAIYEGKFSLMLSNMKADFEKSEVRVRLVPENPRRRRAVFPRVYPEVE